MRLESLYLSDIVEAADHIAGSSRASISKRFTNQKFYAVR
jgi:hypothetical protein